MFPVDPLQNCLFAPELQWQSRGKRRILQGCQRETPGPAVRLEQGARAGVGKQLSLPVDVLRQSGGRWRPRRRRHPSDRAGAVRAALDLWLQQHGRGLAAALPGLFSYTRTPPGPAAAEDDCSHIPSHRCRGGAGGSSGSKSTSCCATAPAGPSRTVSERASERFPLTPLQQRC